MFKTTYNSKAIQELTKLSQRQISHWDKTDFIKPSIRETSGRGCERQYSFTDLVQFRVAKALKDEGISLQKMRKSIAYLEEHFHDIDKPLAKMKFLTDGKTIFVLTKKKKVIDTLSQGQLVLTIGLGQMVEELKGEAKQINKTRNIKAEVITKKIKKRANEGYGRK